MVRQEMVIDRNSQLDPPQDQVSIVMCTYNGEKHLREQLNSLLLQTFPIYEIIVQDDRSTDATWSILTEYAQKHTQIKLYSNQINLGVNQNFLSAFTKATGRYIAISDQDDVWEPQKIEVCMKVFASGLYTMVYSDSYITDENLVIQCTTNFSHFSSDNAIWMGVVPGHSMVFKRAILGKVKNFDQIDFIYDWLINLVAVASGAIKKTQLPLTYWRRHTANITDLQFEAPVVEYKKPMALTISVLHSLWRRKSMKNFKWQFDNIYLILKNFDDNPSLALILQFLKFYKQETIRSFIAASFAYMRSKEDVSFKEKVKAVYTPLYRYYYYKRDGAGLRGKD